MYDIIELNNKLVTELRDIAKELNIPKHEKLLKQELIYKILDYQALNPVDKKSDTKPDSRKTDKRSSDSETKKEKETPEEKAEPKKGRRGRKRKSAEPIATSNPSREKTEQLRRERNGD